MESLKVIEKKCKPLMDREHRICYGGIDILIPNVLKEHYNAISFSSSQLERALSFFKAIHGDLFDESRLRCMMPNKAQAPLIFIYEYGGEEQLFVISPRMEDDLAQQNNDKVSLK